MLKKKIKLWETEVDSKGMILVSTTRHDWAGPEDSTSYPGGPRRQQWPLETIQPPEPQPQSHLHLEECSLGPQQLLHLEKPSLALWPHLQ